MNLKDRVAFLEKHLSQTQKALLELQDTVGEIIRREIEKVKNG